MKIFLINGPKRSGKDETGKLIESILKSDFDLRRIEQLKAATPLFRSIPQLFGMDMLCWATMYNEEKETPDENFNGMSPRDMMIWLSEDVVKPKFGSDHFGKALGRSLLQQHAMGVDACVVTDCGFTVEINAALDMFYGDDINSRNRDVYLIRTEREGTTFDGDSRGYIDYEDIETSPHRYHILHNNSNNLTELGLSVYDMLSKFAKL